MTHVSGATLRWENLMCNIDREVSYGAPTAEELPKLIGILSRYGATAVG